MTHDEAIAELKRRWQKGEREIEVNPLVYDTYRDGLISNIRVIPSTLVTIEPRFVMKRPPLVYRDARVTCADQDP